MPHFTLIPLDNETRKPASQKGSRVFAVCLFMTGSPLSTDTDLHRPCPGPSRSGSHAGRPDTI